jgi:hypothetical protein
VNLIVFDRFVMIVYLMFLCRFLTPIKSDPFELGTGTNKELPDIIRDNVVLNCFKKQNSES